MPAITLAQAEAQLTSYLAAETAVLSGQAYSIGGRSLTRANLRDIREGITHWNTMVQQLSRAGAGKIRVRQFIYDAN